MTFEVEAGGRKRAVEITGAGRAYRAVVDGRAYAVDVARVGDIWSLLVDSAEPVLSSPALRPAPTVATLRCAKRSRVCRRARCP